VTKSAKSAWSTLLVELAPVLAAFLLPMLLRRFTAPAAACGCGEGRRKVLLVAAALLGYAAFIAGTVLLVKLSWRLL
jgi:hypothetical protein